jgi:2-methylcitrate dehydratase PrpD
MGATADLAAYVANLRWEAIPEPVRRRSKMNIFDTLGVALRGSQTAHAKAAYNAVGDMDGAPQASVIGRELRLNVVQAAFLNALAAHSIDFDDAHRFVHPGCAVVTAALSLGEKCHVSGPSFIAAVIAGYDASVRVSQAAGITHRKKGYHPTGSCNFFGASAASAHILELRAEQVQSAFGIAGTQAAGLTQYRFDGSANKHFHAGMAAEGGLKAALLAHSGFIGTKDILEGRFGVLNVLADGGEPEKLTRGLGKIFAITETDIKPYPSCRQTHTGVDLALTAFARGVKADAIKEILVEIYEYATESWLIDTTPPVTGLQAMLNIPYCLAVAIIYGKVTLEQFERAALRSDAVLALARKVKVVADGEFSEKFPDKKHTRLLITMNDGQVFDCAAENPKGSPDMPFLIEDIEKKFSLLAEPLLGNERAQAITQMIRRLEETEDVASLAQLLRIENA